MSIADRLLDKPWILFCGLIIAIAVAMAFWPRFAFDASSDTLVVKGDPNLIYYLRTVQRFGDDPFVVLTWAPRNGEIFDRAALDSLDTLETDLVQVDGVANVFSVLDAPLFDSPPVPLDEITTSPRTLRDPDVDLEAAKRELTTSPLFGGQLISKDGTMAALRVDLDATAGFDRLVERRNVLHAKADLTTEEQVELDAIEGRYRGERVTYREARKRLIREIRDVRDRHSGDAAMSLGGVPMIAADMVDFARRDVMLFGALVLGVFVVMLWLFFRRLRWVLLPLGVSSITVALLLGWLGFLETPVTVVSSNFIPLIGIIAISFAIHLIVRHRELIAERPELTHAETVKETLRSKFAPSFYTALTDMVAFASLLTASIVPVEDFGWMMCVGVAFAFVVTFTFYPAALLLLRRGEPSNTLGKPLRITELASRLTRNHHRGVLAVSAVVALLAAYGLSLISLENRFIDYFREDSEIHRGMIFIDRELGGTLPFEIILSFEPFAAPVPDADDPFFDEESADPFPARYWFTPAKLARVDAVETYVREQRGVGSTLSLAGFERVARRLNNGQPLDLVQVIAVLGAIPETLRIQFIDPLSSPRTGELRITGRIRDSEDAIDRRELVRRIQNHAVTELGIAAEDVHITGMMVLFEDSLQKLFDSQVNTISWVVAATFIMFLVLLRSIKLAVIGIVPVTLAAIVTISFMGYAGIPLDMMTITIASIAVGIGVDDAIHYLHRFREELALSGDAAEAVRETHSSIGRAMYFTSVTVMIGFSILVFSNFVPTVHFGVLTGLAMAIALTANLALLPSLLMAAYGRRVTPEPTADDV